MTRQRGRYVAKRSPAVAEGWRLERHTQVSHLFGANGMRIGPDGRLYIAQCVGSQISAVDLATGEIETISPLGGDIIGPDDIAFDDHGNIYATEFMDGRVSVRRANGETQIVRDDVPHANGITFHQGRLFIDESRMGGRLLELDLNGGAPRVVAENLAFPNALAPGPDGWLYFPLVVDSEIWRIHPDSGRTERVTAGLSRPVAVKFDSKGFIISPQQASGEVLRIDPQNGNKTVLATLDPGLDNLTFMGERLFISHMTDGRITEILADGKSRNVLAGGFHGPFGLAVGDDGRVYVADHVACYVLKPGGGVECVGTSFVPGFAGGTRGMARVAGRGFVVTTWKSTVALYQPEADKLEVLAEGLGQPYGVAVAPDGTFIVAEFGAGRVSSVRRNKVDVLAAGLRRPIGVAVAPSGECFVSEEGGGRIVKITGSAIETVLDGLQKPQGIAVHDGKLYVVDAGAHSLISFDIESRTCNTIAADLPVGAPPGVIPKPLRGGPFSGPFGPFAGIAAASDGTLYFSADAEGSIMALRPEKRTM